MILPQINARLKAIAAEGFVADFNRPATPGGNRWIGNVGAYYKQKNVSRINTAGNGFDRVKESSLIIPGDLLPVLQIKPNETLSFMLLRNRAVVTFSVRDIEEPEPLVGQDQRTVKLILKDISA